MELKEIQVDDFILAEPRRGMRQESYVMSVIQVDSIQPGGVMSEGKHYPIKKYTFRAFRRGNKNG